MMLPAYGGQKTDCMSRASHTFAQGTTEPLPNTQHRDGQGFGISLLESCRTSGVYPELGWKRVRSPFAGMFAKRRYAI
jgi:hypothetical protein